MNVKVKALTSFAHGAHSMNKGQESTMPEAQAEDLAKHGFVKVGGKSKEASEGEDGGSAQASDSGGQKAASTTSDGKTDTAVQTSTRGEGEVSRQNAPNGGTVQPSTKEAAKSANKAEGDSGTAARPATGSSKAK